MLLNKDMKKKDYKTTRLQDNKFFFDTRNSESQNLRRTLNSEL